MKEQNLIHYFEGKKTRMLEELSSFVQHESPSTDKELLDQCAVYLKKRFQELGADTKIYDNTEYGSQVKIEFNPKTAKPENRPALILCHYDTVWSKGTITDHPFRIQDDKAWGPGVFDMKGGIVQALSALQAIRDETLTMPRPVIIILTGDEEIGSPSSRSIIEENAKLAEYVLVPEPPLANGALKTARKGCARYVLEFVGKEAHSGIEPEKGISAIEELAHQILYLYQLPEQEKGTTVNVGVVQGGSRANIIAAKATADVDIRVWTNEETERIKTAMQQITPVNPKVGIKVTGGFTRPPMERSQIIAQLFEKAKEIAKKLRIELKDAATGGGSDSNFTAVLGVPTLDGLGPIGEGAHTEHEHVVIAKIPERAALFTALLLNL